MIILRWLFNALALLLVAGLVSGFQVSSIGTALIVALVLGLVNAVIRPVLVILTLPINILTLGLFTFVINALMLLLVSSVVKGFTIDGFGPALEGALILWLISLATNALLNSGGE
jgi:putative membrane protein